MNVSWLKHRLANCRSPSSLPAFHTVLSVPSTVCYLWTSGPWAGCKTPEPLGTMFTNPSLILAPQQLKPAAARSCGRWAGVPLVYTHHKKRSICGPVDAWNSRTCQPRAEGAWPLPREHISSSPSCILQYSWTRPQQSERFRRAGCDSRDSVVHWSHCAGENTASRPNLCHLPRCKCLSLKLSESEHSLLLTTQ